MELDVRPEPPEPVRRAIAIALAALREEDGAVPAWWRAGLAAQDDSAGLPRSSDGAERA